MTQLNCSVQNCSFNEDQCCCKGDIMVEGREAKESESTCCGSFHERTEGMKNAIGHVSKSIDVDCEAVKCAYNENCKCSASQIGIAGSNACKCEETECATFKCEC